MFSVASLRRGLLLASVVAASSCSDLRDLARVPAGAAADTTEPPEQPSVSREASGSKLESTTAASSFAEIRRSLRRLVEAEETFFAENGTYSDDFSHIGVKPGPNTQLRFLWISRDGWAASGTHAKLPGLDCVIFVGQAQSAPTTLKYVRSGGEGVPVCDESRAPAPRLRKSAPAAPDPAPKPKPEPADTASALDVLDPRVVMKVDLRNLAHSQDTYFRMQGVYARRTQTMALQYLWHRDVRVEILSADAESWAAKATHARFPGKSCVIWFGPVPERPATAVLKRRHPRPAEPVCDD